MAGLRAGSRPSSTPANEHSESPPPPGQAEIVLAALSIGITLMGLQLWLLTVALDMYLGGKGKEIWQLALLSGAIFVGGLLMARLIIRRPKIGPYQSS